MTLLPLQHLENFSAMPGDTELSPTLKAVPNSDISYDDTLFEVPSFLLGSKISAVGGVSRDLSFAAVFRVIERTVDLVDCAGPFSPQAFVPVSSIWCIETCAGAMRKSIEP